MHEGSNVHVTMVQLPGLNTPQFDHCRSKMPKKPMPVPPIYQPEVAAEAIHYAAYAKRREVWCGGSTVYTILGERLAPWLGDRYLAKTGVSGQQTNEPRRRAARGQPVRAGRRGRSRRARRLRLAGALAVVSGDSPRAHRATVLGSAACARAAGRPGSRSRRERAVELEVGRRAEASQVSASRAARAPARAASSASASPSSSPDRARQRLDVPGRDDAARAEPLHRLREAADVVDDRRHARAERA